VLLLHHGESGRPFTEANIFIEMYTQIMMMMMMMNNNKYYLGPLEDLRELAHPLFYNYVIKLE